MLPTSCQNSAPTRHEEAYSVAPRWRGCLAGSMQGWVQFTGCQIQRAICRLTSTIPTHFRTGQATSLSTWNEPYWKWVHRMRSILSQYSLTQTDMQWKAVLFMHNSNCTCWREDQTHVDMFNTKSAREGQTTDKHAPFEMDPDMTRAVDQVASL